MNLTIVTAANQMARLCLSMCKASIERYCQLFPDIKFQCHEAPPDTNNRSWSRLALTMSLLPACEFLLWIDCDAMIVGKCDFREIIQPHSINIAKDNNGINDGVVAWKNCDEVRQTFDRLLSMREQYADHPFRAQGALGTFIDELDVFYQPKHVWNAYPKEVWPGLVDEVNSETMVAHYPGMAPDVAYPFMKERLG
jgi:hypothetical protein